MTDDLVARLREDAEMLKDGHQKNLTKLWHSVVVKDTAMDCAHAADRLEAAEARVRELEAERDKWDRRVAYDELRAREYENRATQQSQIDALTIRAEKAERALAEAYERAARTARKAVLSLSERDRANSDIVHDAIDTAIRKLAKDVL